MAITIDIRDDALYQLGQEEGLQKGKLEGEREAKEETALNMIKRGMDLQLISEVTGLSPGQLATLKRQMDKG